MSQIKRFSEPCALFKKERQRWSNFCEVFLVKSSWMRTSHISFPEFSLATIFFFMSGGIFSWSFWLFWLGLGCIVRHTYITLLIQCLCVMSSARRFWREDVIAHRFPGIFVPPIPIFFLYSGILLISRVFFLDLTCREEAIHMISVEISSTRNDVRIPALNAEPLAGKSGSKGVDAETNIKNWAYF